MNRDKGGPSTSLEVPKVEEFAIIPPDGRWGWLVVVAAFYCNVVIDGIIFTFGMYSTKIMKAYASEGVTEAQVALISSLMFGSHLMAGPLCAGLTKSFGLRPIVVTGAILTALCLASTALEPPFWALTIILGVILGIAMCFVYMNSVMITSMYFYRFRLIAVGIVVCGTGAGTVIFSEASHKMVMEIPWTDAHLYLAACALLIIIPGLIFRPIKPMGMAGTHSIPPEQTKSVMSLDQLEDDDSKTIVILAERQLGSIGSALDATSVALEAFAAELHHQRRMDTLEQFFAYVCRCCCRAETEIILMNPQTKMDLITGQGQARAVRATTFTLVPATRWERIKNSFTKMDWKLLKIPSFVLFAVSGALACTAVIMLFFYESDQATKMPQADAGAPSPPPQEGTSRLVSTLGASNMIWRILLGLVSLLPRMNYRPVNILCHFLGGAAILSMAFTEQMVIKYVLCAIIGAGLGAYAVFRPVLLLEIVGVARITYATGISFLMTGVLAVIGPPIGSLLIEQTGDPNCVYYISGSLFLISGVMMCFIPPTRLSIDSNVGDETINNA